MNSGVYQILNLINGKRYIGSSKNILKRFCAHKNSNQLGKHSNAHLTNAFKKYGIQNFEFSILEECEENILFEREQYWVDCFDMSSLYNKRKDVKTNVGVKWTEERKAKWRGRKLPQSTLDKMSKNCIGNRNPRTEEQKESVRRANKGRPGWNKGTKGLMKPNQTSFKKGIVPWNKNNPNAWRGPSKAFELVSPDNSYTLVTGCVYLKRK